MSGRAIAVGALAAAVCAGCGGPKAYVRAGFLDQPPRRVAVLPFVISYDYDMTDEQVIPEEHTVGRELFRQAFYHTFATYGYEDMPWRDVDATLREAWGPLEEEAWTAQSPSVLGTALGVDALVYGELHRLMHFTNPLYTETSLVATLRMVDAATGEELWRQRVSAAERGGALLKKGQVAEFVKDQVRSYQSGVKFLRVVDAAVRQAVKGLPNPPLPADGTAWQRTATAPGTVKLAVLPLDVKRPGWREEARRMRTYLVANLQEGPFTLLELQRVDAALEELGWIPEENLPEELSWQAVGQALGAPLVLRGTVTKWGRSYWIVQSWVKAKLALELIEAESGEVIWAEEQQNTRTAGLLKGPTGYKSLVTAPLQGLRGSHMERVANHLARKLSDALKSSPGVLAYVSAEIGP